MLWFLCKSTTMTIVGRENFKCTFHLSTLILLARFDHLTFIHFCHQYFGKQASVFVGIYTGAWGEL